jgi:hypothetical protein
VRRRLRTALVTAAFFGSWLAAAPAGQAESSTLCVGSADIMQITPGWSLQPTRGTGITVIEGTQECTGPLEGYQPTGPMRTRHEMVYGYLQPNTCSDIDAKGWVDYSIPTADGVVAIRNHVTATLHPSSDPPGKSGTFSGDHASGRFFLRPIEGDCVNSPLTRLEARWISTWDSERRK